MGLFDLSSVVGMLATNTITVSRPAANSYDANGVAVARTFSTFDAAAAVQPVRGRDLARMPEGLRGSEMVAIHCATELRLRDRVAVPSRGNFEVAHVDQWGENGSCWKVFAKQLAEGE